MTDDVVLDDTPQTNNNNQKLIDDLRQAADFLEGREGLPKLERRFTDDFPVRLYGRTSDPAHFMEVARTVGSFKKTFGTTSVEIDVDLAPNITLNYEIAREDLGCKQTITWDCPDGLESFLRPDTDDAETETDWPAALHTEETHG